MAITDSRKPAGGNIQYRIRRLDISAPASCLSATIYDNRTGFQEVKMDTKQSGQPYNAAHIVERQMLLHDALDKASRARPSSRTSFNYTFITISRDRGSLGDAIARELGQKLGWLVYDKELVEYIAHNSHVRQHLVQRLDERAQNLVHETVQRLLSMAEGGSFGASEYHESLLKSLTCLAVQGGVILVGRGANFVLQSEKGGLHIRIVGSSDVRLRRLAERWSLPEGEARHRMQENDQERRNFIRHHFKRSIDDPAAYDLFFNTDQIQPARVVESVYGIVASLEGRPAAANFFPDERTALAAPMTF
jgi:hypothetical protein